MARVPHRVRTLRALARVAATSGAARMRYLAADARTAEQVVHILALSFDGQRWTVAAWDDATATLRLLDASRVVRLRPRRRPMSQPPDGFDPRDFSWHEWLDATVRAPAETAVWVDEHAAAIVGAAVPVRRRSRASDGGWIYRVWTSRPERLAALACSLSPCAAVHSPSMAAPATSPPPEDTAEARLLRLASWLLAQGEPVTRRQIVAAFPDSYRGKPETVEKKFTRDKEALRRLGYAIETVELGGRADPVGYVLSAHRCRLPRIALTPEEAALVWSAALGAARLSPSPMRDELESALRKLVVGAQGLPPRAAAVEELATPEASPNQEKTLGRLVEAWERRKRITIDYWRVAADEVVTREVDVYGWASRRGEWIFAGYCHLRRSVRIFYLSRVRKLRVNGVRAQDPDYAVPQDFDIRRWSRQQVWDYDVHPRRPVTVRFRGSLARIARNLLPGATTSFDAEGGRIARLEVRNLRGLVRQLLAWGPEAELLSPEDGRTMAREILDALGGCTERRTA